MRPPSNDDRTAMVHVLSFLMYHYNTDFPEFFHNVWGKPKEAVHPDYYEEKLALWQQGPQRIWQALDYPNRMNWIAAADAKYGLDCERAEDTEYRYFVKGERP